MATLIIPKHHLPVLEAIANLTQDQMNELVAAMASFPKTLRRDKLPELLAQSVPSIQEERLEGILDVLIALRKLVVPGEFEVSDVIESIKETLDSSHNKRFADAERELIVQHLASLVEIDSLATWWKALNVISDNDHNFKSARIISDIRPVFSDNDEMGIAGTVIVHILEIKYIENHESRSFRVALDNSDLDSLSHQCSRAQVKLGSIRGLLADAGVGVFAIDSEE